MDEKHPFLDALAEVARRDEAEDRRRFADRLRRLSAGELSEEEVEALRAEAEASEEARLDYEAFRPLDDAFHARVLGELRARQQDRPAEVVAIEPRRRAAPPWRWLAVAAALTLTVAGFWLGRGLQLPGGDGFELPTYLAELEGQRSALRSPGAGEGDLPVFALGDRFRLLLRPESEPEVDPQLAFLLAGEGGELRPWDVGYRVSPDGAVEIEGALGEDLEISPGRYTFVFLYGRPGALPEPSTVPDSATLAQLEREAEDWRALRVPFRVLPGEAAGGELPLEVRYAGCYAVSPGPVCVPYSRLIFWARSTPEATLEVHAGGRSAAVGGAAIEGVPVDGGRRFVVPVEAGEGPLEVVASAAGREARFRLELTPIEDPEWLRAARRLATGGEVSAARAQLEASLAGAPDEARGLALSLLARLAGSEEELAERLEEAVELHRRSGRLLALANDLGVLLHLDEKSRRLAQMRRRLDEVAADPSLQLPELPAEAAFHFAYYRGILENDVGNFRAALEALAEAADLARRLGLGREQALAEAQMGLALERLGRGGEAVERYRQIEAAGLGADLLPCERSQLDNNHAWVLILSGSELGDPLPLLERALHLAAEESCGDGLGLDLGINRALALAQRGETFEARRALAEVEDLGEAASTLHRLWWQELEGRLALAEADADQALESYRRMEALTDAAFEPQGRWRAKVQQAAAHELLGETEPALEAYAEAEALLDGQSLQVPLDAGRERFVADREAGSRRHLDLLLRAGRVEEAFDLARRSRSRVLRGVRRGHRLAHLSAEEQAVWDLQVARYLGLRTEIETEAAGDWRLSEERRSEVEARRAERRREAHRALDRAFRVLGRDTVDAPLPPLEAGELTLVYHPLPAGWVAFAARPGRVDTHDFDLDPRLLGDPAQLARQLLEPFAAAVAESERIRVLAYGALREVDFHALPWEGDVLLAARPVVYGLDLAAPRLATRTPAPRRALVVGDPRGDLPAAEREAEVVAVALGRGPAFAEVVRLDGSAATPSELRRRLPELDLLHVAGHGVADGRDSALLLAGGQLTLGDVLALERAPSRVVLSSCESARDAAAPAPSLGLAQAFLVAGAERVVAALRPVGDRDTETLFRHLYADGEASADLAEGLRQAQLAWRAEDPAADWASFRVLEP